MRTLIMTRIVPIIFLGLGTTIAVLFFFYLYYYIQLLKKKDVAKKYRLVINLIIGLSLIWFIVLVIGILINI
ncbi:MAG: hypothetical protein JW765_08765 [Deltaproteobacteria bacterium]|nr:hypothetical protein [Candidatus Zymogenaceae bacterium]